MNIKKTERNYSHETGRSRMECNWITCAVKLKKITMLSCEIEIALKCHTNQPGTCLFFQKLLAPTDDIDTSIRIWSYTFNLKTIPIIKWNEIVRRHTLVCVVGCKGQSSDTFINCEKKQTSKELMLMWTLTIYICTPLFTRMVALKKRKKNKGYDKVTHRRSYA
jgi:hypothetical protein